MNAVSEEIPYNYIESYSPPILKTRFESHNIVRISGKNKDGTAHVYLDISKPKVIHSNYELGFMDAFVQYTHIAGSAYQAPLKIEFKVYGEGIVKLIWNQVELYRFSTIIDGSCDRDGRNGALGNF